jgi:hypothetical protein
MSARSVADNSLVGYKADLRVEKGTKPMLVPLGLTLLFLAFAFLPRVYSNQRLLLSFIGVGGALLLWQGIITYAATRSGRVLTIEFVPVKAHYVQAIVQLCVYAYFGWYWRKVYGQMPLILAQIVFLYIFDILLCWSRQDKYRLGFGPLPIILGTNLFIWFRDDWFILQFLLNATGALGKTFIRWKRNGKSTHIFNPSALALTLFSLVLILTDTTKYTWGEELATMLGAPPYIYVQIFLLGLVVQFFFSVTLMTLAATAVLCLLNLAYSGMTGGYHFVDSNIPIAVFLGLHLLMTDPATSPQTILGKIIFGAGYGVGVFISYGVLAHFGLPRFYDKLLVVPLLNVGVQLMDRIGASWFAGRFACWDTAFPPWRTNLIHMACWIVLFAVMLGAGFVQARHPGESVAFWQKACVEKRPHAFRNLVSLLDARAREGSGQACNELGLLYAQARFSSRDPAKAAYYFAKGCELRNPESCANVALQFLFYGESRSAQDVTGAFDFLEANSQGTNAVQSGYLLGLAYETGQGRIADKRRAREFYEKSCELGEVGACKNLGRMRLSGVGGAVDLAGAATALEKACQRGDAQSCFYLASLYHKGEGVSRDDERATFLLKRACELNFPTACEALKIISK